MFPSDPQGFFMWLAGAGTAALIVSVIFERAGWFQALDAARKFWTTAATFLGLPFLAQLGLFVVGGPTSFPVAGDWHAWSAWGIGLLLQGLTAFASSQFFHGADPLANKKA